MKTIVLDKNVLQGCDREGEDLRKISDQFHLLLTDVLLQEIYTQGIETTDSLSPEESKYLDAAVERNIQRAVEKAGNWWIDHETALCWEAEKGQSAKYAPHFQITKNLSREEVLTPYVKHEILLEEKKHREFIKKKFSLDNPDFESDLKKAQGDELFETISNILSGERLDLIRNGVKEFLCEFGQKKNILLFTPLSPERDWFSYGYVMTNLIYEIMKRAGRKIYDSGKEVNAFYDIELLAYMALADGIVTNERILPKIAWATWPEKRDCIFSYDRNKGLVQFVSK